MKKLAETIAAWQKNKFDGIVVADGNRGLGKSTCTIQIARRCEGFELNRDIIFSRSEVLKHIATKKNGVIVADEMINVTHNRDFYFQDQKNLIKMLNMYRDKCNLFFACVPNFYALDKQFRDLVKMRINVLRRGLAVIHIPQQKSFSADRWDTSFNEKIESSWRNKFKSHYNRLTTFKGYLKFSDLPSRIKLKYETLKDEKRNDIYEEEINVEEEKNPKEIILEIYQDLKSGRLNPNDLMVTAKERGVELTVLARVLREYCSLEGVKYSELIRSSRAAI